MISPTEIAIEAKLRGIISPRKPSKSDEVAG